MKLVEKMTMQPFTCLYCGKGNIPNNDRTIGPFVDLERDVNFNETVYVCEKCALRVGSCVGMITADEQRELNDQIKKLEKELHNTEAKLDKRTRQRDLARKRLSVVGTSIKVIRNEKEKVGA
jgi:hypothetical protein